MQKSEKVDQLFTALGTFRANLSQPKKDAKNPFFKSNYVTLEGVQKAIDDAIKGTGLTYTQWLENSEKPGEIGVVTLIMHSSGQFMESTPFYLKPEKNTPQAAGSAATYARRYSLSAMFGISSDIDDDGNQASDNTTQSPKPVYKKQTTIKQNVNRAPNQNPANKYIQNENSNLSADRKVIVNESQQIAAAMNLDPKTVIETAMEKIGIKYTSKTWKELTNEQAQSTLKVLKKLKDSTKRPVGV